MNELEIMQWAIKGIEAEIEKKEKSLKRGLLLIQAHKKGVQKSPLSLEELQNRTNIIRGEIETLGSKKAYLKVQTEEWE